MFKKVVVTALAATALTVPHASAEETCTCLLYTSDAADE